MKSIRVIIPFLLLVAVAVAQDTIPAGTVIPIMLSSTIDATRSKPGERIAGRIMQDVPLPSGSRLPARSWVLGHILEVSKPGGATASVSLKFDRVIVRKKEIAVVTDLRAIASMMAVNDAQVPTSPSPDRGTSVYSWTTMQVGGDVVYRGGGSVVGPGSAVVGTPANANGVLAQLGSSTRGNCRGAIEGSGENQALWVFSSSACGAYGFDSLAIGHAGRTAPVGEIVLESPRNVHVPAGSGLLLRVTADSQR
ncbi:MAG TPA: hypothetical protein VK473_08130 [Terriglobales bacterium]|nr:hypothetical protein [Terriglobales bacterium]